MDRYFQSRFPITVYNDTAIVDISRRISIDAASFRTPNLFYPVELLAGMRPDVLADAYYQDSELDWVIYLSNQIVDPYYGWLQSEEEFQSYLLDKYGDVDYPKQKIKFYRNNWVADDTELTPSFYDNTLVYDQKQYYQPTYGEGAKIVSYKRKPVDWTTNTNKIYQYTVRYYSGVSFTEGELVDIRVGMPPPGPPPNPIRVPPVQPGEDGVGEVITSNSTMVMLKNISGNSVANSIWNRSLVGQNSASIAATNEYVVLQENITNATADFWTSVSYYDWERERNEAKKHVYLLNPGAVVDTSNAIRKKLQE